MADDYSPRAVGASASAATTRPEGEEGWFDRLLSAFGLRHADDVRASLQQALAEDSAGADIFSPEERRLLRNILSLRDVRISDVMVPRADIEAVPEEVSLADLMTKFREAGHSRLPVYRETMDDPVGFVLAKDVMIRVAEEATDEGSLNFGRVDLNRPLSAMKIVRPILFVPPTMPAMDLMVRMQANRTQLALVIDEYGGTDGLVSLEDLIETVVGEIEDEYDWPEEATMEAVGPDVWISDARVSVDDFQREAGVAFPAAPFLQDVDTLGGIVFAILGRVPVRGETVTSRQLEGFVFEVVDADLRRIKRVKVSRRDASAEMPASDAA
jgi:CBS domain containing-hemolysin-like protein